MEQAIELSLKNNKDIENARLDVERAEDVVREERAALFPTLSLTSDLEYSGSNVIIDSVTDEEIEETAESNGISLEASEEFIESNNEDVFIFDSSLILNYDIFTSGGRAASIRAAEKEEEVAMAAVFDERVDLLGQQCRSGAVGWQGGSHRHRLMGAFL